MKGKKFGNLYFIFYPDLSKTFTGTDGIKCLIFETFAVWHYFFTLYLNPLESH